MRKSRRHKHHDHENTDRWLVSYADFITLLFAFFVVMYSMSSINEGKYRVLSDTLVEAFKTPPKAPMPIQLGQESKSIRPAEPESKQIALVNIRPQKPQYTKQMDRLAENLSENLAPLVNKDLIKITKDKLWVKVEINNRVLFSSGEAKLSDPAYPVLEELSEVLRKLPNHIDVEGHTDNIPISTSVYPSNWELSAARAASVVHLFTKNGVNPERLSAIGFGEFRPLAENDTGLGRNQNRRVAVVILADKNARRMLEIER
ncbi:MAG: flagellar motor protein MotD [Gammaproteobacteria bacterium]|nr:flagellar motor protein MotD [Gammaproteobacteria bacterium]